MAVKENIVAALAHVQLLHIMTPRILFYTKMVEPICVNFLIERFVGLLGLRSVAFQTAARVVDPFR